MLDSPANRRPWYVEMFENYARKYDNEVFVQGTLGECDFLEKEFGFNKSLRILDIGCGTGRHAIELSGRGYSVTGIDLSEAQLARAREKAEERGLQIDFQRHDARNMPFEKEFDAAIMLCEGGFSLMETDEMNFQILQSAARALKPGGTFIFTCLNGLFPLYHNVEEFMADAADGQGSTNHSNTFDLMTFRDHSVVELEDDAGNKKTLQTSERFYVPSEITWMLTSLGFESIEIFGSHLGEYSREHKLTTEDFEMLVVARLNAE